MSMIWSAQQTAVFDWVRQGAGNAFIEAVAGAGKTTTLVETCSLMDGAVAFTAFNKKIADEIGVRILARGHRNVFTGTFHKFGLNLWRKRYPKVQAGPEAAKKKSQLVHAKLNTPRNLLSFTDNLINQAKQRGIGTPGCPIEDASSWLGIVDHFGLDEDLPDSVNMDSAIERAMRGLRFHNEMLAEYLDFTDMLYAPVYENCRGFENDWVLVDEAQDTNPIQLKLARLMLRKKGRAMFVGDPHQSIYGYSGADAEAINQIITEFRCVRLPLTVTYRCPKAVVDLAKTYVSHIEAHSSAPNGSVLTITEDQLHKYEFDLDQDAILCRNTRPLVKLAYILISKDIPAYVEGRDIGKGLLKLINKFSAAPSLPAMLKCMDRYLEEESARLKAKNKDMQAAALEDRVETVRVLAENCDGGIAQLKGRIDALFDDGRTGGGLTLSTVHKAKGREWKRVFVLGHDRYMPSCYARKEWEMEQENNLIYVAYTRAKSELVLVKVEKR